MIEQILKTELNLKHPHIAAAIVFTASFVCMGLMGIGQPKLAERLGSVVAKMLVADSRVK